MTDGVHRHIGRRARSRVGLPIAAATTIAVLGGLRADAPWAGAADPARRALASQDSPVDHGAHTWSAPTVLAECRLASRPRVAFPSEGPAKSTGAGAILWASDPAPCGSTSLRSAPWGLSIAVLGSTDRPTVVRTQSLGRASPTSVAAVGASFGRVAIAAASATHGPAGGAIALLQGRTARPDWQRQTVRSNLPPALAHAYLADVAIAAVAPGPKIEVRVERHFQLDFGGARSIAIQNGAVSALTA